jgi:hypothetical protein
MTLAEISKMFDGATNKPDPRLQAAHLLISELMGARLDLMTQLIALDEQRQALEARVAELTKSPEAAP